MTTGGLISNTAFASMKPKTARPSIAHDNIGDGIVIPKLSPAVAPRGAAASLPTSRKTVRSPAHIVSGMLTDYYNNIYAIPSRLEVQNPLIGAPQPWALWNAFLETNTITDRVATGDGGLINDGDIGEVFRPIQLKPFSVIVTNTAPIQIDATYDYTATYGSTSFNFVASLAVIVDIPPEEPFEQILEYSTDIFRARFGQEYRASLRQDKPRQRFSYQILFQTEQDRRDLRLSLYSNSRLPLVLPQWHEYIRVDQEAPVGTTDIVGDFTLSDLEVGDSVFLENPAATQNELQVVDAITDSLLTLRNVLTATYPAGSHIYPAVAILPNDNGSVRYYPVNALRQDVKGLQITNTSLGGKGATIDEYDGMPVLEARPSANELVSEAFNMRSDQTDFGGALDVFLPEGTAALQRRLSFFIQDRAKLQYWKAFFDTARGQQKRFLHSTYQDDVIPISFTGGGTELIVENTPDLQAWVTNDTFQRWRIESGPAETISYHKVDTFTNNLDGTATIILDVPIPDQGLGTTINQISFLQKCRIAGNNIRFLHFDTYSRVNFSTESIIS